MAAEKIKAAASALDQAAPGMSGIRFLVGFDGFVDEILHAVATRRDKDHFERIRTLEAFGKRIVAAAGKSTNIELVPQVEKIGGNGPLMAMAVSGMGCRVTCLGLLGYPDILPVFKPMEDSCRVISVGNPGHTDALEFTDGKLMLGKLNTIREMNWERIAEVIGEEAFAGLLAESTMVASTNRTMLTEMEPILDNIQRLLPTGTSTKFFFDLADPEKRPIGDIRKVIGQIQAIDGKANSILGLNLKEAQQIGKVLGLDADWNEELDQVHKAADSIGAKLGIHGVVVHAVKFAAARVNGATAAVQGPYCANPKLTTGAGDHFNGGFSSALMAGLSVEEALFAGVGTSGAYVRKAGSPSAEEVVQLLRRWAEDKLED